MGLSREQIESYGENGYLVVPGLASSEDVEELRRDTLRICRGVYPHEKLQPMDGSLSDDEVLRNFLCIHHPHKVSPVICERGVGHAGIADVLAGLIGPDVKCMQSMLFVKPPDFQGQAWHQDEIYIPTRDRSLTGAWIALDDATVENGCLWVLPGTHKGVLYDQRPHDNPDEFDFAPESYGFDDGEEIPVEVKAGDVVFFNGYLLHRSRKNRSQIYRRALVNHYMNAWSLLPWQMREGESPSRADYRDIVIVHGEDPYSWKGLEDRAGVSLRTCKALEERD
ncbi:MAG: phytanoyl-CoA dioxygenase family protein [Gemmatimonadetes bacterium]|nr:phytanoyl-CoA dioxygenase family protein [Gemmatimonadota bacterium]